MRTKTLLLAGATSLLFALPAMAADPCSTDKIYAKGADQGDVVNCYVDAAILALQTARMAIQQETPADEAGSTDRWKAMAAIDAKIAAITAMKYADGVHVDIRVPTD